MAKEITKALLKKKINRKGVHAKSKMSSLMSSKNYTKKNKGQG